MQARQQLRQCSAPLLQAVTKCCFFGGELVELLLAFHDARLARLDVAGEIHEAGRNVGHFSLKRLALSVQFRRAGIGVLDLALDGLQLAGLAHQVVFGVRRRRQRQQRHGGGGE